MEVLVALKKHSEVVAVVVLIALSLTACDSNRNGGGSEKGPAEHEAVVGSCGGASMTCSLTASRNNVLRELALSDEQTFEYELTFDTEDGSFTERGEVLGTETEALIDMQWFDTAATGEARLRFFVDGDVVAESKPQRLQVGQDTSLEVTKNLAWDVVWSDLAGD